MGVKLFGGKESCKSGDIVEILGKNIDFGGTNGPIHDVFPIAKHLLVANKEILDTSCTSHSN